MHVWGHQVAQCGPPGRGLRGGMERGKAYWELIVKTVCEGGSFGGGVLIFVDHGSVIGRDTGLLLLYKCSHSHRVERRLERRGRDKEEKRVELAEGRADP